MNAAPSQIIPIDCLVQNLEETLERARPGNVINLGDPYRAHGKDKVEILSHPKGIVIHTFRIVEGHQKHEYWLNGSVQVDAFEGDDLSTPAEELRMVLEGIEIGGFLIPKDQYSEVKTHHRGLMLFYGEEKRSVRIVVLS